MEASALPASVGLVRPRIAIGASFLRIRSDEQLVSLFRSGSEDAFRVIHDRYRPRMLAYTRQMLHGSAQDPEDAVQEVFVRAYAGLRASDRDLALRAWLYRIAHNRCIDELRRPRPTLCEEVDASTTSAHDPFVKVEQRDALRRLIADVQRLPEQQRSALLMRELAGMAYADMSGALGVSVPAVKSLLVRARVGLAQASEARDTACAAIRDDLIQAHDRGVRTSGLARRHIRDCPSCREFRSEVRGVSRQFAALVPALGPVGVIAHLLGWGSGGGAAAGTSAAGAAGAAGSGAAGAAGGGAAASAGVLAGGAGHVVTLLAAAVVTAGGAVEIQRTLAPPAPHRTARHHLVATRHATPGPTRSFAASPSAPTPPAAAAAAAGTPTPAGPATPRGASQSRTASTAPAASSASSGMTSGARLRNSASTKMVPISETLDPDRMMYGPSNPSTTTATGGTSTSGTTTGAATGTSTPTATGTTGAGSSATTGSSGTGSSATTSTGGSAGAGTSTSGATGSGGAGTGATTPSAGTGGSGDTSTGTASGQIGVVGSGSGAASESAGRRGSVVAAHKETRRAGRSSA